MTDERLAEIEKRLKTIQRIDWTSNEYKPANAMYMTKAKQDIKDIISALRTERQNVIELGELSKSQSEIIQTMMQQKNELNNSLEAERSKVAGLESTNQWMHGLIKTYQAEKAELQKEINMLNDTIDNMVEQSE